MTDERWEELKNIVKEKFAVLKMENEKLDLGFDFEAKPVEGFMEIIEFDGPMGRIKLERTTKPAVLDKKTLASRRIGGDRKVQYIYDRENLVKFFKVYKWNEMIQEWEEIRPDSFN